MKRIGIVGGLSPESTILYYKTIIEEYRRRYNDYYYPIIMIYSVNFGEFTDYVRRGIYDKARELLLEAIKALARAGADFALISANTPHMFFEYLKSNSPIPLLSIIDALAEELKKDNITRIGLLGTEFTLTKGFYANGLRKHGIEAIIPDREDIAIVNNIIYYELVKGIIKDGSREKVEKIIMKLIDKGAEAIALACTELPLLIKKFDKTKIYDTARIHAIKALEYAIE